MSSVVRIVRHRSHAMDMPWLLRWFTEHLKSAQERETHIRSGLSEHGVTDPVVIEDVLAQVEAVYHTYGGEINEFYFTDIPLEPSVDTPIMMGYMTMSDWWHSYRPRLEEQHRLSAEREGILLGKVLQSRSWCTLQ